MMMGGFIRYTLLNLSSSICISGVGKVECEGVSGYFEADQQHRWSMGGHRGHLDQVGCHLQGRLGNGRKSP